MAPRMLVDTVRLNFNGFTDVKTKMIDVVEYPENNPEAVLEEFKIRVFAAAAESVEWATAPLVHFEMNGGKAIDIRTGVLIEIAAAHFLVTAAHGMQEHFDAGDLLQIVLPDKVSTPVPLISEQWWSTVDPREDLNVCQLQPETVQAMGPKFRFLRLSQMISRNEPEQCSGVYLLVGYPLGCQTIVTYVKKTALQSLCQFFASAKRNRHRYHPIGDLKFEVF